MDNLGRVIMEEHQIGADYVQNADGSITFTSGSNASRTWFEYDGASRLTKVTDPDGKETRYEYNSLGVLVKKYSADNGASTLRYDQYGQIRFTQDQKDLDIINGNAWTSDQFTFMKYDEWGRMTETGQYVATESPAAYNTHCFDDYSKINDQDFPLSTDPLVKVYQEYTYDGDRANFESTALLMETIYDDHIANAQQVYNAAVSDRKSYTYLADGQLAGIAYDYDGLATQTIEFTYNSLKKANGKKYIHPENAFYNFEWKSTLDNFGRTQKNQSTQNGLATTTGSYYYDVLGNLLMTGFGETGNTEDPHVDYHVVKMNIRDHLVNSMSKNFRFGLKYDNLGNIIDQYWSNEHFDPTDADFENGGTMNMNHYKYTYDQMNRLIGADYSDASLTTNPFAYFETISSSLPSDFLCGLDSRNLAKYLAPTFRELRKESMSKGKTNDAKQASNALRMLSVLYQKTGIAYSTMTDSQREELFDTYVALSVKNIDVLAYERYMSRKHRDADHMEFLARARKGTPVTGMLKYTRDLFEDIPFYPNLQCSANANATVYGYLPNFEAPPEVNVSEKYDAAYWYTNNGNISTLHRTDDTGDQANLDYFYPNTANNQLGQVTWSGPDYPEPQTHAYQYDGRGNLLSDAEIGGAASVFNYDNFDDMPRSITNENGTIRYRYDAQRMRSVKRISAEDTEYVIDGVILDHLGNVKRYEIPEGFVRPFVDGEQSGMDYFYTVRDWLGTNRTVLDANGVVQNSMDHYPFGKIMPGRAFVSSQEGERYQFTGHEFDDEIGYGYHGARYYNREIGRYMGVDPLAEQFTEWSPYNYVMGNPVKLIDPDGRAPADWVKGGMGADNKQRDDRQWHWVDNITSRDQAMQNGYLDYSDGISNNTYPASGENGSGTVTLGPNGSSDWRFSYDFAVLPIAEISPFAEQGLDFSWTDRPVTNANAGTNLLGNTFSRESLGWGSSKSWDDLSAISNAVAWEAALFAGGEAFGGCLTGMRFRLRAPKSKGFTYTKTAAKHFDDVVTKNGWYNGKAARPYMNSPSTIKEIMSTGKGIRDATFKGGRNYKTPGTFRGAQGIWELGVNPKTKVIYHFLFKPL